ncbi:MAG: PAS domain S-box protein [Candidatus Brocadiia bacterium]
MADDGERGAERRTSEGGDPDHKTLRAILRGLRDVLYLLDLRERSFVYVSPAVERVLGLTPRQFVDEGVEGLWARIHPEERERVGAEFREVLGSRQAPSGTLEFRLRHHRGEYRWVSASQRVVRGGSGEPRRLVGTLRDVTDRKRAEAELRREPEFVNTIIETSAALIVVLDADGRILRFNRACRKLTGYAPEEVEGRLVWELLIPEEEREEVRRVFEEVTRTPGRVQHQNHWLTRDGEQRLISWTNTCAREGGKVRYVVATGVDVTERQQLEERLRRAARLEAVGQLAGGIAHDFNNLLTAIIGYCDLTMMEVPDEAKVSEDILRIKSAAKRAANLSERLLAFGRREPSEPKVLDLNERVSEMTRMLRHVIEENIELNVCLSETPLKVRMDPAQLERILVNLAVNARDAMPDGGRLTVAAGRATCPEHSGPEGESGACARLTVQDTGVGMGPEVRERIFDPFFTTKDRGYGTGLGLATVYGLVQQQGGHIECESEPGEGTRFDVYLPLLEEEAPVSPEDTAWGMQLGGDETVLLVEDDEGVREMGTRVLEGFGYTVLTASDGREGLELFRKHRSTVDLLVTDVVMPQTDGLELAEQAQSLRPDLKVLYVSGYAGRDNAEGRKADAAHPLLPKPFTASRLAQRVREVLDEP